MIVSLVSVFGLPSAILAVGAAIAGFFCRALQVFVLGAAALGVALLCMGLAASDNWMAPFLIVPILVAYASAAASSLLLGCWMERDYQQEIALQVDDDRL